MVSTPYDLDIFVIALRHQTFGNSGDALVVVMDISERCPLYSLIGQCVGVLPHLTVYIIQPFSHSVNRARDHTSVAWA